MLWRWFVASVGVDGRCPLVAILEFHVGRALVELAEVRSATATRACARLLRPVPTHRPPPPRLTPILLFNDKLGE